MGFAVRPLNPSAFRVKPLISASNPLGLFVCVEWHRVRGREAKAPDHHAASRSAVPPAVLPVGTAALRRRRRGPLVPNRRLGRQAGKPPDDELEFDVPDGLPLLRCPEGGGQPLLPLERRLHRPGPECDGQLQRGVARAPGVLLDQEQ